jgi:nitrate/nitrite transport system substrate-binding protein
VIPVRIGIVPLADAAPIVAARELGCFADEGLDVTLSLAPSWATLRDELATGALDAAHLLAPMALASGVGLGPFAERVVTALSLGLGGNAITVSNTIAAEIGRTPQDAAAAARALAAHVGARRRDGRAPLCFATVFPHSMHEYELRYWLASAGLVPHRDVRIRVVPPPRMVEAIESGAIDGFCVGEPWSTVAVQRGAGRIAATKHAIWESAPEKVLGVRESWAAQHAATHRALLRALLRAAAWCDEAEHRPHLVTLMARAIGASEAALAPALVESPDFLVFSRFAASFPWRSHAAWILVQMLRWGQIEKPIEVRGVAAAIYRADLHREAATDLGLVTPFGDEKEEGVHAAPWRDAAGVVLGPDRFLDGARFAIDGAVEQLAAQSIHDRRVDLAELAAAQRTRA